MPSSRRSDFKPMKFMVPRSDRSPRGGFSHLNTQSGRTKTGSNRVNTHLDGTHTVPGNPNRQVRFIPDSGNIVVSKGEKGPGSGDAETININLDDIRNRLQRLRLVANDPIKNLSGSNQDDFRALVRYTQLLYDTPAYKILHDQVKQYFCASGNEDLNTIQPGTVGAYFAGCLVKTSFTEMPGCSVICAGSMPLPPQSTEDVGISPFGSEGQSPDILGNFCQYSVIWGIYDGNNYQFTTLHEAPNKDDVIVFVDTSGAGNTFPGFTDDEKTLLSKFGAKRANLIRYSKDSQNYTEILGGFVPLDKVPSRVSVLSNYQATSNSRNLLIILLILLVIVAIFIGWRIMNKS
jgi:hypothetical protein